jgi:hypothetical protein
LFDAAVTRTIERAAVGQVGTAGEYNGCAGAWPWFRKESVLREREDGVVWREELAQGVESLAEGVGCCAGSWGQLECMDIKKEVMGRTRIYQDVDALVCGHDEAEAGVEPSEFSPAQSF